MANFEIPEKPEYSEEIRKFEEEDPGHADLFNAVVETLLNNEVFLKKLADSLAKSISGLNTLTKYTTVQTPNPSMGAQIVQKENTELDMETGLPFPFPIQEVVAGHELALRQLNTDTSPTGIAVSSSPGCFVHSAFKIGNMAYISGIVANITGTGMLCFEIKDYKNTLNTLVYATVSSYSECHGEIYIPPNDYHIYASFSQNAGDAKFQICIPIVHK